MTISARLLDEIACVCPTATLDYVAPINTRAPVVPIVTEDDLAPDTVSVETKGQRRRAQRSRSSLQRVVLKLLVERPGSTIYDLWRAMRRRQHVFRAGNEQHAVADALARLEANGFVRGSRLSPRDAAKVGARILWEAV